MPTLNLTKDEYTAIAEALETEIKSIRRAQKAGRTPHIQEVYLKHLEYMTALQTKVLNVK